MSKSRRVRWTSEPAEHDYPAATSFLELLVTPPQAAALVAQLQRAATVDKHAKDVLRAARLPLLPSDDPEVAKALGRVAKGVDLSPILLVRGNLSAGRPLQVADGYHRLCASYHLSEDTEIPCRIADHPTLP